VVDARVDRLEVAGLVVRLLDARARAGAGLHRGLDVDDRRERLVVDDDELGAVLGGGLGLGDDERDRLAANTTSSRASGSDVRSVPADAIGRSDARGPRRPRESRGASFVDAADARVRLGREDGRACRRPWT
jgi:hypothetical protein